MVAYTPTRGHAAVTPGNIQRTSETVLVVSRPTICTISYNTGIRVPGCPLYIKQLRRRIHNDKELVIVKTTYTHT